MTLILRDYQEEISENATKTLQKHNLVCLYMEVRTGKTITCLEVVKKFGAKKVLFLTKKKAIGSISRDYEHFKDNHDMQIINYESLHKVTDKDFDLLVCDESHKLATYPKPNKNFREIKKRFGKLPIILLSGTPTPESFSQFFHQIFISHNGPFKEYRNFYSWAKTFVKIGTIYTSYGQSNDYSDADYNKIIKEIEHLIFTYTQKDAGFTTEVKENILYVKMKPFIYRLAARLQKDKVIEGAGEVLLADTMLKEKQKLHQLFSGTVKFESGNTKVIDDSKGVFIKEHFKGKKIGIFYNFKAEKDLLKEVFGDDITDDLDKFNSTDKNIMLQIVSGREGISLKKADCLVYFNIAFSALSYWQSRDRLTTKERTKNNIYWIFTEGGLDDYIYEAVQNKKNFTTTIYKKLGKSNEYKQKLLNI